MISPLCYPTQAVFYYIPGQFEAGLNPAFSASALVANQTLFSSFIREAEAQKGA